ncbi:MAG: hypothetical protein PUD50_01245, partial [Eubacteriales bacterium]|nr:hypothetical protein [Eubacteriales bacterium]
PRPLRLHDAHVQPDFRFMDLSPLLLYAFFLCFGANGFCNSTSYVRTPYCHSQLPNHIFTITSIRRFQRFCISRLA